MISARIPRRLLYANQSSPAGGFRKLFWTWGSLEKASTKYQNHSSRRNAIPKYVHQQSRRNGSLSNPPASIPSSGIDQADAPIDSSSETIPSGDVDQVDAPIDSSSETIPSGDVDQANAPIDSSSETIPSGDVDQANAPIDPPSETLDESCQPKSLSDEVRKIMRHVPHPVVVLTTPHLRRTPDGESIGVAGMTLSSFNTITLSPDPIITFNVKRLSATLDALKSTQDPDAISIAPGERERRFHIHILQSNKAGSRIAHQFSRGGPISTEDLALLSRGRLRSKNWPFPMAQGVRRAFECEVLQEGNGGFIDVNDHTLVFGKVKEIIEKSRSNKEKEIEWGGLCYMHGRYHTADCLVKQIGKREERRLEVKPDAKDEERLEVKEDEENLGGSMLEEGKKADS